MTFDRSNASRTGALALGAALVLTTLTAPPVATAGDTAPKTEDGPPSWTTIIHRPPIYDLSVLARTS